MMPEAATPERVDGVCKLIRSFTPWRDIEPDPEVNPPPFSDQAAASRFILQEASGAIDRFIGFGQGYAGHMLTFGQSLVEMAAMGDVEWAESCREAFRKYVTVTRIGPESDDRKIADHKPSKLRPNACGILATRGDRRSASATSLSTRMLTTTWSEGRATSSWLKLWMKRPIICSDSR